MIMMMMMSLNSPIFIGPCIIVAYISLLDMANSLGDLVFWDVSPF